MAGTEGLLSADPNSYELNSGAESVDDKRDFTNDQIIEGQFTVLLLGFDEDRSNSDVMMLFHFDIINDKINILQIPSRKSRWLVHRPTTDSWCGAMWQCYPSNIRPLWLRA